MRKLLLSLAAVAALFATAAAGETYVPLTEDTLPEGMVITYAERPDFSNIGKERFGYPKGFYPILSPMLINALCNNSPPIAANMWANLWTDGHGNLQYESFSSPTCSWIKTEDTGEQSIVMAVAFEADGTAWMRVNLYYPLLANNQFEPFTPAQLITEARGLEGHESVFFTQFPLNWQDGGKASDTFIEININEAEAVCEEGLFFPITTFVLGPAQGVSPPKALYAPACMVIDPRDEQPTPLVIFGVDGQAYYEQGVGSALANQ